MTDKPSAAELFAEAGRTLYGEQWQVPLARLLEMDERTMRRIAQAAREGREYRIAIGALIDLKHALMDRLNACGEVAAKIQALTIERGN